MALVRSDVEKIAHLSKLHLDESSSQEMTRELSQIMSFVEQMDQVDTAGLTPMAHPQHAIQRLREDTVTETDHHQQFQEIAPQVDCALYLVPRVID
jgi:aspartyl-tRNA(Asn)/glutamyl-tRNA(Gln) amidotransferase subunit C